MINVDLSSQNTGLHTRHFDNNNNDSINLLFLFHKSKSKNIRQVIFVKEIAFWHRSIYFVRFDEKISTSDFVIG